MKLGKKFKILLGWLLALIIIAYLCRIIYLHRAELSAWQWDINWLYALMSAIMLGLAYLSAALGWRAIIDGFGLKVGPGDSFRILYLSQLGRYIPGKIWQVFGMIALSSEVGIPPRVSLASFVINQAYFIPASFLLIPIFIGNLEPIKGLYLYGNIIYLLMTIIFLIFLFFFIKPNGLNRILNWVLKKLNREPVEYNPDFKNRLFIFFLYLLTWLLFGLAFFFFLKAILPETILSLQYAIGTYIAAYSLGYLSFFSPGGLGFREGIITALLTPFIGAPIAVSVSLINRVWITIIEAIISLIALLTYRFKVKKVPPKSADI